MCLNSAARAKDPSRSSRPHIITIYDSNTARSHNQLEGRWPIQTHRKPFISDATSPFCKAVETNADGSLEAALSPGRKHSSTLTTDSQETKAAEYQDVYRSPLMPASIH